MSLSTYSYADTVDTWTVYFNDSLLISFSSTSSKIDIILDSSLITSSDSLKIVFNTDHPCVNCEYYYYVSDDFDRKLQVIRKRISHQFVTFPIKDLLLEKRKTGSRNYLFQMGYTQYVTMKGYRLKLLILHFE